METSIFLPALPEASDALPFPSITDRTELRQESERPGKRDPAVRAEGCWFRGSGSFLEGFMLGGRVGRLLMQPPVHNGANHHQQEQATRDQGTSQRQVLRVHEHDFYVFHLPFGP